MDKIIRLFIVFLGLFSSMFSYSQELKPLREDILFLSSHLTYLASDKLEGRNTPSVGLDSAAQYIEKTFIKLGIPPAYPTYRNSLGLSRVRLGPNSSFSTRNGSGVVTKFKIKSDFIPFDFSSQDSITAPVIFAGFGLNSNEANYNNYKEINVKGRIVILLTGVPSSSDSTNYFKRHETNVAYSVESKVQTAIKAGAVGVIVITDPEKHLLLNPVGYPWPELYKNFPLDASPWRMTDTIKQRIPVFHAGESFVNTIFGSVNNLKQLVSRLNNGESLKSLQPALNLVSMKSTIYDEPIDADNVAAVITGSDPDLNHQVIVIGAHYDHLGMLKKYTKGDDYIFNGADDNASGASSVLAIARNFMLQPLKPKRSVIFVLFAGEEKGLWGSRAFVNAPPVPISSIVAMINLDMVSRSADTLYLEGASNSPALTQIVKDINSDFGFKLITPKGNAFQGSSDHAPFAGKGVPFVFFFTGLHKDYHRVTDEIVKCDFEKATQVARLAFLTAWRISNEISTY
ncbi:MAG: M20/M25/M40 family metallo-hydrolase [Sphingobacteriia bacterium]|nr:M20/M25/M40 family metallo-hydrolase [Sphingobacteriia bacterium]